MAFSYMLPNFYGNATNTAATPTNVPTSGTGNVAATSVGGLGGFGFGLAPDLSYAAPGTVQRLQDFTSNYTYSVPAGGYISNAAALNANSRENKFGGADTAANATATSLYSYLGTLPTTSYGSLALQRLYGQAGNKPPPGPSMSSLQGGMPWQGPFPIGNTGYTSTPLYG